MKLLGPSLLIVALGLAGCATRPAPSPSATAPGAAPAAAPAPKVEALKALDGTAWTVIELAGEPLPPPPEGWEPLTLEFSETGLNVFGHGGVNRFSGRRKGEGRELIFGPLAMTRRAGPSELMEREHRYTQVLSRVVAWRQDGANVILVGPGAERAAVLQRVAKAK